MTRVKYYTKYLFTYMLVIIIFYGFLKFMNYVDIYKILNGIYSINIYKLYICIYYIMNFLNIYFLNKLCLSDIFTLKYSYITRSNKNKKIFSILLLSIFTNMISSSFISLLVNYYSLNDFIYIIIYKEFIFLVFLIFRFVIKEYTVPITVFLVSLPLFTFKIYNLYVMITTCLIIVILMSNIYGLIGKNGSGKTMLLKAMSGFLRPSNGKVIVNDQELYLKEEFPKDMGVMIGNCEYIKDMTGKDNLKYLASLLKKIDDDRINEVIDIVNLTGEKDQLGKKY